MYVLNCYYQKSHYTQMNYQKVPVYLDQLLNAGVVDLIDSHCRRRPNVLFDIGAVKEGHINCITYIGGCQDKNIGVPEKYSTTSS